jgi:hypothetical protein
VSPKPRRKGTNMTNLYSQNMSLSSMKKKQDSDLKEDEGQYLTLVAEEEVAKLSKRYEKEPQFMRMVAEQLARKALSYHDDH